MGNLKTARLIRIDQTPHGTFGLLVTSGGWWWTMERPWLDNEPFVSCIPVGEYECHWTRSETLKKTTYILGHVTDRDGIRIHAANSVSELEGCIALGNRYGERDGERMLLSSGAAIKALHKVMGGHPFILTIQDGM